MRCIVAGGREFTDAKLLFNTLDKAFGNVLDKLTVISGGARGADALGEEWAKSRGVKLVVRKANWDQHGKAAGHIRNEEMITEDKATHCVVFWNGVSKGTKDMFDRSVRHELWIKMVRYQEEAVG